MELRLPVARTVAAASLLFVFCGCAFLAAKPSLPRHGEIESAATPTRVDELDDIVSRAEIFYLPTDRLSAGGGVGAGQRMLEALRRSGPAVGLGLGTVDTSQQPLLDQWSQTGGPADDLLDRVTFASTEHRESCRLLLRATHAFALRPVALRCLASPGASDDPCLADNIIRLFRSQAGEKLLVVMERRDLEAAQGVPYFVAQKLAVRQLVLDSKLPATERAPMLTRAGIWRDTTALKIVDCTPRSGSDGL